MVILAATKVDELQLNLKLSDRHLERRAKQTDSLEAKLQAQAEKAWASGQAAAQAECAKMKRRFTRWGAQPARPPSGAHTRRLARRRPALRFMFWGRKSARRGRLAGADFIVGGQVRPSGVAAPPL